MIQGKMLAHQYSNTGLLFSDTFYHEVQLEEMHLDLVGFPRPVAINEMRVIPRGCRIHADIKDKFGETSPRSFKLEIFIKNLNKPNATVFEKIGTLDYVEGESIQLMTYSKLATNVVLFRGWYSRLTVCLYGELTEVKLDQNQAPPPPPMDYSMFPMQHQLGGMSSQVGTGIQQGKKQGSEFEKAKQGFGLSGREHKNEEDYELSKKGSERNQRHPASDDKKHEDGKKGLSKERNEYGDATNNNDNKGQNETDKRKSRGSPKESEIKSLGESTEAKSKTTDKGVRDESPKPGIDTLFEPLSPEDDDFFDVPNDGGNDEIGYEDIESDEDNFDDFEFEETADLSNFHDLDLYGSEDTWMSVSVSFNPYQCYLSELESFEPVNLNEFDLSVKNIKMQLQEKELEDFPNVKQLQNLIAMCENAPVDAKWVSMLEEILTTIPSALVALEASSKAEDSLKFLVQWTCYALDFEESLKLPVGLNIRQIKAGVKLAERLCRCNEKILKKMMEANIQHKLFELLKKEHMASSLRLLIIHALDSTTDMALGMEHFLGWNLNDKIQKDSKSESGQNLYEDLVMYLLTDPTVRIVTAIKCLLRKVHFYESLANFQNLAERISTNMKAAANISTKQEVKKEELETDAEMGASDNAGQDPVQLTEEIKTNESLLSSQDVHVLISALDDIYSVLENAQELIAQPALKSFPTSLKLMEEGQLDYYPTVFSFLQKRRFLESLLVVISSPVFCEPAVFSKIRDMIFYLLDNEKGLLFLASEPNTVNGMIRVLTQASESESHYSEAPSLKELRYDSNTADNCVAHHLGLLLIYHLQSLQGIDQLISSTKNGIAANEMDDADNLSTLHTLYSMTFTPIGKVAVTSVLSQTDNLKCLIPFVELSDENEGKVRRSVSSKYASVLLLLTLQMSDNILALEKFGSKLLSVPKKEADSVLTELGHFLAPLNRIIKVDVNAIGNLVEYIKSELDSFKTNANSPRGVFTALRLLKHICVRPDIKSKVEQKDVNWNLSTIQLFSANAMDTCIQLLNKLGERLITPWRQNQPFSNHQCFVLVSQAVPLLQLIRTMVVELVDSGKVQLKDTRLLHGVFVLHTILCSKPTVGQLFTTIQQVQTEIVAILLKFTSVTSLESQDGLRASSWHLMLKELVQYTDSKPQAFLSGVTLLSELLPVPLPVFSIQELSPEDLTVMSNHRLLWMAHISALGTEIQTMLKSLVGSCCNSLQHSLRKLCLQLADLGPLTALSTVRLLCDILDNLLTKTEENEEEKETKEPQSDEKPKEINSFYAARVMSLLASVVSQPGGKMAFLVLIRGSKAKDGVEFPNLLPAMLQLLGTSTNSTNPSTLKDGILGLLLSIVDTEISMTEAPETLTTQDLANCLPNNEMMQEICKSLLSFVTSDSQSYQSIVLAIRTLISFSDHDLGMQILKRCLEEDKNAISEVLKRVCKDVTLKENLSGAIDAFSTLFGFLQLLLPPMGESLEKEKDVVIYPQTNRKVHIKYKEMRELLHIHEENLDHLTKLEKSLEDVVDEDETVGSLCEAIVTFKEAVIAKDDNDSDDIIEDIALPEPESLQFLYSKRSCNLSSVMNDDRTNSMLWFLSPPSEEIDMDDDMVNVDLEQIAEKYCPGFNLKEEVEKGFLTTDDQAKRPKRSRRKYDPLIHGKGDHVDDLKRQRLDVSWLHHGRGGFRGRGRGFGRGYVDMFRSRKQNTSRPPSMHVDDFVMMESNPSVSDSQIKQQSKNSFAPVRDANSEPRFTTGFNTSQGRWASPNDASFRREGQHMQMGRGNMDSWNFSRAPAQGTFSSQYSRGGGFQRGGSSWNPQIPSPYRAPRESESTYPRTSFREGYWAGPKTKEDNRFFAGGGFGNYRQGQGNGRDGFNRHFRTFTR